MIWPTIRAIRHTASYCIRLEQGKPSRVVDSASQRRQMEQEKVGRQGRTYSGAENRTRDCEAPQNSAHPLSYHISLSHIKTVSSQPASKGAYNGLTNGASDTGTSGPRGHPEEVLSHAPQQVASDGTCSMKSPTIHHCHRVSGEEQKGYIIIQAQVFIQ